MKQTGGFRRISFLCVTAVGMLFPSVAQAYVLDWNTVDWTPGTTTETISNIQGSGMDITISLAIVGAAWAPVGGVSQPAVNNRLGGDGGTTWQGEYNTDEESLHLHIDAARRNFRGYVNVVIRFSRPATGVSFSLFDVDDGGENFEDVIGDIHASLNGADVAPATVSYDPAGILYENHATRGEIYRGTYWSPDAVDAVLGLAWTTQVVDEVSFRYYAGNNSAANPGTQGISISDITFYSAVPEAGTMAAGAFLLAALVVVEWRRRRHSAGNDALQ
jgi:hypothetical protein